MPIDIVFDGPPAPEGGRFVEVEINGRSVQLGTWKKHGKTTQDLWALSFDLDDARRVLGAADPKLTVQVELRDESVLQLFENVLETGYGEDWFCVIHERDGERVQTKIPARRILQIEEIEEPEEGG